MIKRIQYWWYWSPWNVYRRNRYLEACALQDAKTILRLHNENSTQRRLIQALEKKAGYDR